MNYPSRCNRTHNAAEVHSAGRGFVCGRAECVNSHTIVVCDESGSAELTLACGAQSVSAGDIVEVAFASGAAQGIRVLAKAVAPPTANADLRRFDHNLRAALRLRARLIAEIRSFFVGEGFLEVETPSLVASPGLEPHLRAFATEYCADSGAGGRRLFLPTSPEYHMKRLLAAGFEKIFQLCRSYRNGESFGLHNPEFTMLEWYRAYADAGAIMADFERLGERLARTAGEARRGGAGAGRGRLSIVRFRGKEIDFAPPWPRITVREAFRELAGIKLPPEDDAAAFREAARGAGVSNISDGDSWEDVFYKVFLSAVEPGLGAGKPVFLTEYPASMAALAKRKESDPSVAERFELFIGGVEIANGFTELNDPGEQRRRFLDDRQRRREMGAPEHPVDERLLDALNVGMPPAGGVAAGLDRLVMVLAGKETIADVMAFPFSHDFP